MYSYVIFVATNKKKKRKRKKKTKSRTDELKLGNHNDSQGSIHSIGSEGTGSTPASPEVSVSFLLGMQNACTVVRAQILVHVLLTSMDDKAKHIYIYIYIILLV